MATGANLTEMVSALPEIYQPIWRHPELSTAVSRPCDHRFASIAAVYDSLAAMLERPARVLDLGCAQGWFSLALAERGALVRGVDFNPANIAVCRELARRHPELDVWFEGGDLADVVPALGEGEFDLVLGLSVFHHLCEARGKAWVRALLVQLLGKVPHALLELALAAEPPAWRRALPENPAELLEPLPFFRVLSRHPTHLSNLQRPLYFCSRTHWYLQRLEPFTAWHAQPGRRVFSGADKVAKLYSAEPSNLEALAAEAALPAPPSGLRLPQTVESGVACDSAWVVTTRPPGVSLADLIATGGPYDAASVLRQALTQLAFWESGGLFHRRLHARHLILDEQGGIVIADDGELATGRAGWHWPEQPFVAFWLLAYQVLHRQLVAAAAVQAGLLRPQHLPAPFAAWSFSFWNSPAESWNFAALLEHFPA